MAALYYPKWWCRLASEKVEVCHRCIIFCASKKKKKKREMLCQQTTENWAFDAMIHSYDHYICVVYPYLTIFALLMLHLHVSECNKYACIWIKYDIMIDSNIIFFFFLKNNQFKTPCFVLHSSNLVFKYKLKENIFSANRERRLCKILSAKKNVVNVLKRIGWVQCIMLRHMKIETPSTTPWQKTPTMFSWLRCWAVCIYIVLLLLLLLIYRCP